MDLKLDSAIRSGCTCMTCRLVFESVDLQKEHYSSEWHRYNAKRQVADLPPITKEQFESKIKARQEEVVEQEAEKRSKKKAVQIPPIEKDEEMDYDETKAIPVMVCMFCSHASTSFDDNLMHMSKQHGFFIPDSEYCVDVEGLIEYLGEKVGCGNFCIHCQNKRFRDLNSCQLHMRDKAHCMFSVEGEAVVEYLDYYDYGELLKDEGGEENNDVAVDLGYTLILPSGAELGHRTLMRYYKQRLRPDSSKRPDRAARRLHQDHMKALGWTGTSGATAIQRARDFKFIKNIVKRNMLRRDLHANTLFKSVGRGTQM